jgi:hypothetical protein
MFATARKGEAAIASGCTDDTIVEVWEGIVEGTCTLTQGLI